MIHRPEPWPSRVSSMPPSMYSSRLCTIQTRISVIRSSLSSRQNRLPASTLGIQVGVLEVYDPVLLYAFQRNASLIPLMTVNSASPPQRPTNWISLSRAGNSSYASTLMQIVSNCCDPSLWMPDSRVPERDADQRGSHLSTGCAWPAGLSRRPYEILWSRMTLALVHIPTTQGYRTSLFASILFLSDDRQLT